VLGLGFVPPPRLAIVRLPPAVLEIKPRLEAYASMLCMDAAEATGSLSGLARHHHCFILGRWYCRASIPIESTSRHNVDGDNGGIFVSNRGIRILRIYVRILRVLCPEFPEILSRESEYEIVCALTRY
jgi:hypothetical protein